MGVTDLQPYFTQIICHNSVFIGFLPNLVLRFALMSPLSVPNFSPIQAHIHVLSRILQSVRKEEEKNEEKNPNFGCSYLGNG